MQPFFFGRTRSALHQGRILHPVRDKMVFHQSFIEAHIIPPETAHDAQRTETDHPAFGFSTEKALIFRLDFFQKSHLQNGCSNSVLGQLLQELKDRIEVMRSAFSDLYRLHLDFSSIYPAVKNR
jgi:hypothetical protein